MVFNNNKILILLKVVLMWSLTKNYKKNFLLRVILKKDLRCSCPYYYALYPSQNDGFAMLTFESEVMDLLFGMDLKKIL